MKTWIFSLIAIFPLTLSAQELVSTETEAVIEVVVTDFKQQPREGEQVILVGENSKKEFKGITNAQGSFKVLIPEGDDYLIRIKSLAGEEDQNGFSLPSVEGIYEESQLAIQYEMQEKVIVLDDVHFDTGKSTLRSESFPALKDLLEVLKLKKNLVIEVAGHTDNVGDDNSNLVLSKNRARAVREYLLKHGVEEHRVKAEGYGETEPIASNESQDGRQQNRRTEVRILSE